MKKIFLKSLLIIIFIFFILTVIYFIGILNIKNNIKSEFGLIKGEEKTFTQAFKEYEIIQCKFDLLNPEYVFVSHRDYSYRNEDRELWKTTFYKAIRNNIFSANWQTSYTGGTTIKNTTFPELVKMVKEDCSQFQKPKGDRTDESINWSYSAAPSQEDKDKEAINILRRKYNHYSDTLKESFIEKYGNIYEMSDDELLKIAKKVENDQELEIQEEAYELRDDIEYFLSQKNYKKIVKGLLKENGYDKTLGDEELIKWEKETKFFDQVDEALKDIIAQEKEEERQREIEMMTITEDEAEALKEKWRTVNRYPEEEIQDMIDEYIIVPNK